MLDESIELIVVGKLDPGTQVAIPGEVVKGFLAANRLINSIRMRYQASILTGGSGLVKYVSSANRPNAIPGGDVIFAGDVTQVIAEEGTLPLFPTGGIAQKVKNFGAANYFGAAMGYVNQNEKKGLGMSLEDMNRRQGANKRTSPKPASRRHMKEELRWTEKHMQEKWDNRESDDIEMWIDENNKYKKDVYEL